jgi:hypothetical protein
MDALEGVWRLVDSRGWDEAGNSLVSPYGQAPMGEITFRNGRMLAAVCNGDTVAPPGRSFSSYGGTYAFDGETLTCAVDVASDPSRIGGKQTRTVTLLGSRMVLRPPQRAYGQASQQRELLWEKVWTPAPDEERRRSAALAAAGWNS